MSNSNQIKGEERGKPEYLRKGERRLKEVCSTRVQWPLLEAGGLEVPRPPAGCKGCTPVEIQVQLQMQYECGISLQLQLPFFELGSVYKHSVKFLHDGTL